MQKHVCACLLAERTYMYTFDSRIRYSEIDKDGTLTLESLIDYFQDCSTFQTQEGVADIDYMKKRNIAWVLNSWQIEIMRYPRLCEDVIIGTVPYDLKGFFGLRNFFMDTKDGERLAVANSVWTLFDFVKGIPSRVTPEMLETYPMGEKLDMNYAGRKIVVPEGIEAVKGDEIVVRKHHLDTNYHVNNGQYVRMAIDACSDLEGKVKGMRAEYKRQAVLGDILYPNIYKDIPAKAQEDAAQAQGRMRIVDLADAEGRSVCTVELNF